MIWAVAFAVWVTVAAGVYLALSRDVLRCVVGLALIGSAVNLLLLASGRLGSAQPAVIEAGARALGEAANPLPQALVLTAVVIGFALMCFALVLVMQLVRRAGIDDAEALRLAEPAHSDAVGAPYSFDESRRPVATDAVGPARRAADREPSAVTEIERRAGR